MKDWIENTANDIMENHSVTKKGKQLFIDGVLYTANKLKTSEVVKQKASVTTEHELHSSYALLFDALRDEVSRQTFIHKSEIPETSFNHTDFLPVVDIETNTRLMLNNRTRKLSTFSYDAWYSLLDNDSKANFKDVTRLAKFEYDPYDVTTLNLMEHEHLEVLRINLYSPPAWRLKEDPEAKLPIVLRKFLHHLFPNTDELTYVLDWLYFTLVDRNETYLVLNGAKGAGKGLFSKLSMALVGEENYSEAPESLLQSGNHFNSVLDKKRVILIDEVTMDKEKHTRLKRFANKKLNVEKKGVDADKTIETFNSFIISNNDDSDVYLEHDDRRFSVPKLTHVRLLDKFTHEEIDELDKNFDDPESQLVLEFGYWLYNRGAKKYTKVEPLKGERFFELVESSLHLWQRFLLESVLTAETEYLAVSNLRSAYSIRNKNSKFPQDRKKITDFLQNYLHKGSQKLGTVVQYEGELCIKVNPIFTKDIETVNDEDMI